ncbi:MAG TPA: GerMN domain-containing protein, partial [Candidatus Staskawiczbacteria bacterium]|nr:GerMN domain-containing protein [Candidatus Staskawiczbacteria bacterium]
SCNKVFEVKRTIPKTEGVARAAIEELLKGPTQQEIKSGYYTSINSGVKLNDISIQKTNPPSALVDFDDKLEFQVGGSCKVGAIRAQITQTLKQFPSIEDVIISINGRTEDILQP